jgi:hypothetical protein
MTTNNSFLEQCKADYCQNFVKVHSGEEGFLKTEDGKELHCKFKVGQFEDGNIILICDFSVFDLQKCFPMFYDLEESSMSEIKMNMVLFSFPVYSFFEKFKNFNGISSDRLMNITGTMSFLSKVDNNSIDDHNSERVRIAYSMAELIVNTDKNENLQYVEFGITNFKFGNESDKVLSLDIKGVKGLIIRKNDNYEDTLSFLKCSKGIRVTCNVRIEIDNKTEMKDLEGIICDLCDLMSIACGTRIQWIYYFACNFEGEIVLWSHLPKVTKPCYFTEIIDYRDLKNFLESSYVALAERSNLLRHDEGTAKPLINAYLDAKAEIDYLEGRGIKLVVVMEMLKQASLELKLTTKSVIRKEIFDDAKSKIENLLSEAITESVNEEYGKKSEQDKDRIVKEIKGRMFSKISGLNDTKSTLIGKSYFRNVKPEMEKILIKAIRESVNEEHVEKSEQDKDKVINDIKDDMFGQISNMNNTPFKVILQRFCEYIDLQIDNDPRVKDDYLQAVVDSRNKLIHQGEFLCNSTNKKNEYANIKDYPQFKDPEHEYYFLMNFVDQCFLKLLHYNGYYYKWKSIQERKREELK